MSNYSNAGQQLDLAAKWILLLYVGIMGEDQFVPNSSPKPLSLPDTTPEV
ncbi:MAG: hypothetical protein HONDAALG_03523 [Gammaproteobacteria bacterium]|nr:hypothetical protein [Gammaproteobacteria bacterium]